MKVISKNSPQMIAAQQGTYYVGVAAIPVICAQYGKMH
jgi:hypothetical protein